VSARKCSRDGERLDKFVIIAPRHLNDTCRLWSLRYNQERPPESCGHLPPAREKAPAPTMNIGPRDLVCTTRLGGLKSVSRRAT